MKNEIKRHCGQLTNDLSLGFFYFAPILQAKLDLLPIFIIIKTSPQYAGESQRIK